MNESAGAIRLAGILRPYFSLQSLRGWALVPPQQHGGFETMRLTELPFDEAVMRAVTGDGDERTLRYSLDRRTVFTLERDHVPLTAPPRAIRRGRYLYVGGRRRRSPEPWMLQ
ncbi:MAG TPA: hypothetical protein VGN14_11730 [Candidatus Elarobacter sp.]